MPSDKADDSGRRAYGSMVGTLLCSVQTVFCHARYLTSQTLQRTDACYYQMSYTKHDAPKADKAQIIDHVTKAHCYH